MHSNECLIVLALLRHYTRCTDREMSTCKFCHAKCNEHNKASAGQIEIAFSNHKSNSEQQVARRQERQNQQNQ